MINLMAKKVYPEKSELLYEADFTEELLKRDFEITGGNWSVGSDGYLYGSIDCDGGGLIYSYKHFMGDVIMDFYASTIAPCANDLNFTFCAKGWDYEKNDADVSYIAGLQGWWTGRTGIEKYPSLTHQAMTYFDGFVPGKEYHIQTGRVGKSCFICIDGKVVIELIDGDPIVGFGRLGFGVYASKARYRNLKVYAPYVEEFVTTYEEIFKNPGIIQK